MLFVRIRDYVSNTKNKSRIDRIKKKLNHI